MSYEPVMLANVVLLILCMYLDGISYAGLCYSTLAAYVVWYTG